MYSYIDKIYQTRMLASYVATDVISYRGYTYFPTLTKAVRKNQNQQHSIEVHFCLIAIAIYVANSYIKVST